MQNNQELERQDTGNEGKFSIKSVNKNDMQVCWKKLDRKSKKVNFMITQANAHLDDKAGAHNIDELIEQIEGLQYKLDEISMNIVSQIETEKVHFERKCRVESV